MSAHRWTLGGAAALVGGLLLVAAGPAPAQPALEGVMGNPWATHAGPVAAGPLPGYAGAYGTTWYASPYAYGRYYHYYDGPSTAQAYSPLIEAPSSVFMTSINYPGQYGSITIGVPAYRYITRPDGMSFYRVPSGLVELPRDVEITPARPVTTETAPAGEPVHLNVLVPSEASLWIEGQPMTNQSGSFREFVSPPLTPGVNYTYTVRASWQEDGREVSQTRSVPVHAGERHDVDFTNPEPAPDTSRTSALRARRLP